MKKYLLFASAIIAFASCTSESYNGTEEDLRSAAGDKAITFAFDVPTATRADNTGLDAATALGNRFIVYGEKSETDDGAAPVTDGSTTHQLVFQNYQVNYTDGSDYTTTSNTKGWEYVGYTHSSEYVSNIITSTNDAQTIKYWDYSATNYVFTAFSAADADLTSGAVKVTKVTSKTTDNKVYDKGYDVVLTAAADPTKLYFSDRLVIDKGVGADRTAKNAYGGNATLTFRNGVSQIRVAMFETIPGHSVKIDKFSTQDAADPTFGGMTTGNTTNFAANVPNIKTTEGVTLHVTYYPSGARVNQPKIAVVGTSANVLTLGTGLFGTALGEDAAHVTYDTNIADDPSTTSVDETEIGAYTPVFPQESNNKTLKLKIDYTLTAPVTGETIHVYGATAEIPAEYLQWKPNFKYTYIFKITDNTNGKTKLPDGVNPDSPEGLYPITFDAVQVVAEDGQAEYITTVSEPSITTFGVKSGKYVHDGNEYEAGSDIYATIMQGSNVITPVLTGAPNAYVYTAECTTSAYITEAAVAEAVAEKAIGRVTTPDITLTSYASAAIATTVPGEDGVAIASLAGKAIQLASAGANTYVIAYRATAGSATATTEDYSATATYYSITADAQGFYPVVTTIPAADLNAAGTAWADATAQAKYTTAPTQPVYVYKVIRVVTP